MLPIPWTAIREYARAYNVDIEEFTEIMSGLDMAFLKHIETEEQKEKS